LFLLHFAVALQVCALLSSDWYVEKEVVPAGQLLPVQDGVSLTDATGLPGGFHRFFDRPHDQPSLNR
jgi:hypothetical protein